MPKKLLKNEFINRCNELHNNEYDYSLVDYFNNKTKIKIICKKHGIFEQTPKAHLNGQGCIKCNKKILSNDEFINILINKHGNYYNYSLVNYKNIRTKIKIICPEHGDLIIKPYDSINNNVICYKCKYKNEFIKRSKKTHNNKYDYSLVKYKNSHNKVKIICKKHGIFEQLPYHHLNGSGCPICNESKGEKEIRQILKNNNVRFISQKIFENCKYKKLLKFDFYLPEHNICIEYDGIHHFTPKNIWGGDIEFNKIKKRDQIKNKYCKENNIKLIRIKYNEKINDKLNNLFLYFSIRKFTNFK